MTFVLPALPLRMFDLNGNVMAGSRLYVYFANTLTPAAFYTNENLSVAHPHPLEADGNGLFAPVYLAPGFYKIRFAAADDSVIWQIDSYEVTDSNFQVSFPTTTKTANFSVASNDRGRVFRCDASGAPGQNIAVVADSAVLADGFPFFVNNTGLTGTITIQGAAGQTIDGGASITLVDKGSSLGLVSIGAQGWITVFRSNVNDFITPVVFSSSVTFSSTARIIGGPLGTPSGRLTLVSGEPVHSNDVTGQSTVFFAPYKGNRMPIYDGTGWRTIAFSQTSQALADFSKSPVAAVANSVYYLLAWLDGSTFRVTRSPAWASLILPGVGAGTAETQMVDGVRVNKFAVTNGPAALQGTVVGCIATDASAQCSMMFNPTPAPGGTNNRLDVWNEYNRVLVSATNRESTDSWNSVAGVGVFRAANNSNSNRVWVVRGLNEESDHVEGLLTGGSFSGNAQVSAAIGVDSVTAGSGLFAYHSSSGVGNLSYVSLQPKYVQKPGIGQHFYQLLEYSLSASAGIWLGDATTPGLIQSGLNVTTKC